MTVKSDDVVGRVKTYESIVKGENIPTAGTPESFKVLFKELQALGLDTKVLDKEGNEIELKQDLDDGTEIQAVKNNEEYQDTFKMVNDYEGQEGFGVENEDGEPEEAGESEFGNMFYDDNDDGADEF